MRACLLEDDREALAAWDCWRHRVSLDELDGASNRLLPLLHLRLARTGRVDADADRVKGVARYYWACHVRHQHALGGILATLSAGGVETLLLKGAALNLTVYPPGTRPMSDLDVAVPLPEARRAMRVLRAAGWRSSAADAERSIGAAHACQFERAAPPFLDLHWNFFYTRRLNADEQRPFWDRAVPVATRGGPARVLCPTHQLLHTCAHGVLASDSPPVRWLADAARVIRESSDDIDWDELVSLARRHELALPVESTLRCLADEFDVRVPAAALRDLRGVRTSVSARLEYTLAARRWPGVDPLLSWLPCHLVGYWRQPRGAGRLPLGEYLRRMHQHDEPLGAYLSRLWALAKTSARQVVCTWGRKLHRLMRGHKAETAVAADTPERWRLVRFHELELWGRKPFRWSSAEASVLLPLLQPAHYRLVLTLAGLRDWHSDLSRHLRLSFNGHAVPSQDVRFSDWTVTAPVTPAMFAEGGRQRLWVRCLPLATANGDKRQLGVPVVAIRLDRVAVGDAGRAA